MAEQSHSDITTPATFVPTASKPRPLLIGVSVLSVRDSLVIMGGSAVCFSFGTFWNKGCFTINVVPTSTNGASITAGEPKSQWNYTATGASAGTNTSKVYKGPESGNNYSGAILRVRIQSSEEFRCIIEENKPVILEGSNLGSCTEIWTPDYLKEKIGSNREVSRSISLSIFISLY